MEETNGAGAEEQIIEIRSEYERLIEEVNQLQAEVARLTALRDDLQYRICPELRALYEEKIGSLEREILAAKMYLREKQRILEILRAQMNRRENVSYEKAEDAARAETRDYEQDLKRKAEEAESARKKWEQNGWSSRRYDGEDDVDDDVDDDGEGFEGASGGGRGAGADGAGAGKNGGDGSAGTSGRENGGPGGNGGETGRRNDGNGSGSGEGGRYDGSGFGGNSGSGEGGRDDESGPGSASSGRKSQGSFEAKVKSLYRKIIKRLHPDVNPNQTEHEKELFLRARTAYENGDLKTLQAIWDELEGMKNPGETFRDTPEDLAKLRKLREKLRALAGGLLREINAIRGAFPYTMKELLENEELLRERRASLEEQLAGIREADAALAALIEEIRQKLNR